jgi:cytochrome b561
MNTQVLDPAVHARRWRDGADTYGRISRLNHWALAVLMIAMLLSGLLLGYAPLALAVSGMVRDWHKAVGVVVLAFGLWRVGWRLVYGFPEGAATTSAWQAFAAKAAHWALLAAIVVMPLSGVLMTLFAGRSIAVWPLAIPGAPEVQWLAERAREVHSIGGLALAGLVALHAGAALKHHLVDRDETLGRMAFGQRRRAGRTATQDQRRTALSFDRSI